MYRLRNDVYTELSTVVSVEVFSTLASGRPLPLAHIWRLLVLRRDLDFPQQRVWNTKDVTLNAINAKLRRQPKWPGVKHNLGLQCGACDQRINFCHDLLRSLSCNFIHAMMHSRSLTAGLSMSCVRSIASKLLNTRPPTMNLLSSIYRATTHDGHTRNTRELIHLPRSA